MTALSTTQIATTQTERSWANIAILAWLLPPLLFVLIVSAAVAGALATGHMASSRAAAYAGPDLTRLLRAMAAIKAVLAVGVMAPVFWRLQTPASVTRFSLYAAACAAMAAGPGLIWGMVHVAAGAVLLHSGLIAALLLLWRDPTIDKRLLHLIAIRRARPCNR